MRFEVTTGGATIQIDQRVGDVSAYLDADVGLVLYEDLDDVEVYRNDSFDWSPLKEEEIVEALKERTFEFEGTAWEAGLFFETGGCSQLAMALAQRNHECGIVAIYDAVDEDGEPLPHPHLIHAALEVGEGHVLDINGISELQSWHDQWSGLGLECFLQRYAPGEVPFAYADDGYRLVSQDFAFVLSLACARSLRDLTSVAAPSPR